MKDKYELCQKLGIVDGTTTTAFQSCPLLCNTCKSRETAPTKCEDDKEWHHIDKDGDKLSCKWIASEDLIKECELSGTDRNGETTTGHQSCRKTCGTCFV